MSKYDIEEITFFVNDSVLYSGSLNKFKEISFNKDGEYLFNKKQSLLNSDIIKCINHNNTKLFMFCEL